MELNDKKEKKKKLLSKDKKSMKSLLIHVEYLRLVCACIRIYKFIRSFIHSFSVQWAKSQRLKTIITCLCFVVGVCVFFIIRLLSCSLKNLPIKLTRMIDTTCTFALLVTIMKSKWNEIDGSHNGNDSLHFCQRARAYLSGWHRPFTILIVFCIRTYISRAHAVNLMHKIFAFYLRHKLNLTTISAMKTTAHLSLQRALYFHA